MKTPIPDAYRIICLVFSGIIIAIFIYSLFFGTGHQHPIPSGSLLLQSEDSPSTGLSRSFSAIVRFRFSEATILNPYGIRIFLFFFIQMFMRVGGYILADRIREKRELLIFADVILSITLFIIAFWPFIAVVITI